MEHPLIAYGCYKGVFVVYDVSLNDTLVGYAQVEKEGLYAND